MYHFITYHYCISSIIPYCKPLVVKHGNGTSPMNGGFSRKITDTWFSFQQAMFHDRRVHHNEVVYAMLFDIILCLTIIEIV